MTPITETEFWLRLGDGFSRVAASSLRILRRQDERGAWLSLRAALLFIASAIGARYEVRAQVTITPGVPVDVVPAVQRVQGL